MTADRLIPDPRPDLGDGPRYGRLLALCWMLDGPDPAGLFGALHGLRCLGARIEDGAGDGGARLVRGGIPAPGYAEPRGRYPLPRAGDLRRLLGELEPAP